MRLVEVKVNFLKLVDEGGLEVLRGLLKRVREESLFQVKERRGEGCECISNQRKKAQNL